MLQISQVKPTKTRVLMLHLKCWILCKTPYPPKKITTNEPLDGIVAAHTAENGPNQVTVRVSLKENFKRSM